MKTLLSYYSLGRNFLSSHVFTKNYRFIHTTIHVLNDYTSSSSPVVAVAAPVTNKAPKLLYDLPEPIQYTGYHYIEVNFPNHFFKPQYRADDPDQPVTKETDRNTSNRIDTDKPATKVSKIPMPDGKEKHILKTVTFLQTLTETDIKEKMKLGLLSSNMVLGLMDSVGDIKLSETGLVSTQNLKLSPDMLALTAKDFKRFASEKKVLMLYKSGSGAVYHEVVPESSEEVRPRFIIAERYNMSSYLGNYAPGRVLKTHALAPGETTTMSVKTFRKSEKSYKESSSMFDSFTTDCESEFQKSLSDEQSDKQSKSENFSYSVDMQASAKWGFASASVSAGVKGGSASAREEFAKSTSSAASREAGKVSSKRDVQVNTESTSQSNEGEEISTERVIKNINVSRTMNLVFRQMNQQYITLTYLTDVRVGFFDNVLAHKKEVSISRLEDLIKETIETKHQAKAKEEILNAINSFIDYKGDYQPLTEHYTYKERNDNPNPTPNPPKIEYDRFIKKVSSYVIKDSDGNDTLKIDVPGYILKAFESVIRTEGVVMDAFLGEGNALDTYSQNLQIEANRKNMLENDNASLEIDRVKLGIQVVKDNSTSQGLIYRGIFHKPVACCPEKEETVSFSNTSSNTPTGPRP